MTYTSEQRRVAWEQAIANGARGMAVIVIEQRLLLALLPEPAPEPEPVRKGRPEQVWELWQAGLSTCRIAHVLGTTRAAVGLALRRYRRGHAPQIAASSGHEAPAMRARVRDCASSQTRRSAEPASASLDHSPAFRTSLTPSHPSHEMDDGGDGACQQRSEIPKDGGAACRP